MSWRTKTASATTLNRHDRHHESSCLSGQLCFAALQHLTSVSCCCCLHVWLTRNQLTIIIKRLSKQTWVWVAECSYMDTGTVFTLTPRMLRCQLLRFTAHGCRSQFSLQGLFVLFHHQLTPRKHWLKMCSLVFSFFFSFFLKFLPKWSY